MENNPEYKNENDSENTLAEQSTNLENNVEPNITSDAVARNFEQTPPEPTAEFIKQQLAFELIEILGSQYEQNQEFLTNIAPHLLPAYSFLVAQYPELKIVQIRERENIDNASFSYGHYNFASPDEADYATPDRPSTVSLPFGRIESFIDEKATVIIAANLGVESQKLMSLPKLFEVIVFLHEMGHAEDFLQLFSRQLEKNAAESTSKEQNPGIKRYAWNLAVKKWKNRGYSEKQNMVSAAISQKLNQNAEALEEKNTKGFRGMLRRIVPKVLANQIEAEKLKIQNGLDDKKMALYAESGLNITNDSDVYLLSKIEYRRMAQETFADKFAIKFLHKYAEEYFTLPGQPEDPTKLALGVLNDTEKVLKFMGKIGLCEQ